MTGRRDEISLDGLRSFRAHALLKKIVHDLIRRDAADKTRNGLRLKRKHTQN